MRDPIRAADRAALSFSAPPAAAAVAAEREGVRAGVPISGGAGLQGPGE